MNKRKELEDNVSNTVLNNTCFETNKTSLMLIYGHNKNVDKVLSASEKSYGCVNFCSYILNTRIRMYNVCGTDSSETESINIQYYDM